MDEYRTTTTQACEIALIFSSLMVWPSVRKASFGEMRNCVNRVLTIVLVNPQHAANHPLRRIAVDLGDHLWH